MTDFTSSTVIPRGRIADLLCTAFEDGAAYWCVLERVVTDGNICHSDLRPDWLDYPSYWAPLSGGQDILTISGDTPEDREDDRKYTLNQESIQRGLNLMPTKAPGHWGDFLNENEDATTGDVFLQLCLFGEVVYG